MDLILFNTSWMLWNIFLGAISVVSGWFILYIRNIWLKGVLAAIWILFLPNTIYMITDLYHLSYQFFQAAGIFRLIVILQYVIIYITGVITFVWGIYPLEKMLKKSKVFKSKESRVYFLIFYIFIISFGVIIGRIQRTNSWEVFTNTPKVIENGLQVVTSFQNMALVIAFTIIGCGIYFSCKNLFISSPDTLRSPKKR